MHLWPACRAAPARPRSLPRRASLAAVLESNRNCVERLTRVAVHAASTSDTTDHCSHTLIGHESTDSAARELHAHGASARQPAQPSSSPAQHDGEYERSVARGIRTSLRKTSRVCEVTSVPGVALKVERLDHGQLSDDRGWRRARFCAQFDRFRDSSCALALYCPLARVPERSNAPAPRHARHVPLKPRTHLQSARRPGETMLRQPQPLSGALCRGARASERFLEASKYAPACLPRRAVAQLRARAHTMSGKCSSALTKVTCCIQRQMLKSSVWVVFACNAEPIDSCYGLQKNTELMACAACNELSRLELGNGYFATRALQKCSTKQ